MASVGSLVVSLVAETADFISGMKRAEGAVRGTHDAIGRLSRASASAMGDVAGGLSDIGQSLAGIVSVGNEAGALGDALGIAASNAGRLATVIASIPTGPMGILATSAGAVLGAVQDAADVMARPQAALKLPLISSDAESKRSAQILEDEKKLRHQLDAFADLSRVAGRSAPDIGANALERRLRAAGLDSETAEMEAWLFREQLESMERSLAPPERLARRLSDNIGEGLPEAKAFAVFLERGIQSAASAVQTVADGMGDAAARAHEMQLELVALQQAALNADERRAEAIKAMSMTPAEKLRQEIDEIERLQQLDLLNLDEAERARQRARDRLTPSVPSSATQPQEARGAQALLFGTSAALIAAIGRANNPELNLARESLATQKRSAKALEKLHEQTGRVRILAIK